MAARRSNRGSSADASDVANADDLIDALLEPIGVPVSPVSRIDEFSFDTIPFDRRFFHFGEPERYSLTVGSSSRARFPSSTIAFADPSTVAICVRRKMRREVMIASGRRGRGGRRRTWRSDIKC